MDISPPSPIYMCVWCVVGYPTSGGVLPVFGCHFGFSPRKKNATRPLHMPIGLAHHGPERLDWVHEWVQRSGLMLESLDNQALLRREVVGLLTPCLYIRGVHALPFDSQLSFALCLDLGTVPEFGQSGESYAAVGIAIAGGVEGLQLDAVTRTCEDGLVVLYISTTITIITLSSIYVIFALSVQ